MAYATTTELAEYLGTDESSLPEDVPRLLERASELINYITGNRVDVSITEHEEAARKATCAQYEWWAEVGDELGLMSQISSMSIAEFSFSGGSSQQSKLKTVAKRAEQYLYLAGLLYRGVELV
jgi:hypothetical protein